MAFQITNGRFQGQTNAGDPLVGGKLYTYATGTTSPQATYTDATLGTPNTNPIILDARGEAQVWLGTSPYTFTLKDANNVTVWTVDGVQDPVSAAAAGFTGTTGAGLIGYDRTLTYAAGTAGWALEAGRVRIPAKEYIPVALWSTLKAGTETTDVSSYLQDAIDEAADSGGEVLLPPWTMCIGTTLTWAARGVALVGTGVKDGNTASAPSGACLKWTGATGGVMVSVTSGAHQARVEGIMFDANDKADTCLQFLLAGGTSQQIHMPAASHLRFNGYRGKALVFGNPDTTVLETGQLQIASLHHCSWDGGGATATVANVFGLVLNAQNCEILNCSSLYFDPFTVPNGGPNINHQSHILVKTGGLAVRGSVMTRADSYDIDILGECGLVVDQVRTEDPLFLRIAPGFASNPISVINVQGRDGTSTGTEIFMSIGAGGGQEIRLVNIRSTGHIQVFTANDNRMTTENIGFVHGASALSLVGGTPRLGVYDIATGPGVRTITNDNAIETWTDNSDVMLYRNDRGRMRVQSLQATTAGNDGLNFGGAFILANPNTTATVTFAVAEPDTNYRVICVPNQIVGGAPGNVQVQSIAKSTGSFTVTFSATPASGSLAFAWMLFRV